MTITSDDHAAVSTVSRWERPPPLCIECEPIYDVEHLGEAAWLYCALAEGHEPPHYDYERGIYWFKPEARGEAPP